MTTVQSRTEMQYQDDVDVYEYKERLACIWATALRRLIDHNVSIFLSKYQIQEPIPPAQATEPLCFS